MLLLYWDTTFVSHAALILFLKYKKLIMTVLKKKKNTVNEWSTSVLDLSRFYLVTIVFKNMFKYEFKRERES